MKPRYAEELLVAKDAALEAGARVLEFYNQDSASVYEKSDGSAVTDADLAADKIIRERLAQRFPDDAILTEEGMDDRERLETERCWIVDPVDGTNQFINRTGEFDVLIALVSNGRPVVGVSYQPTGDMIIAAEAGQGAELVQAGKSAPLHFGPADPNSPPRIMTSSWLGAPENLEILNRVALAVGANAVEVSETGVNLRRFMTNNDATDVFIGLHPDQTSEMAWEWDFAAPDLLMAESGGVTSNLAGELHRYNKPDPRNVGGLVMSRDPQLHRKVVDALIADRLAHGYVSIN